MEIIKFIEKKLKRKIDVKFVKNRKGDVAKLVCNSSRALSHLSWKAQNSNIKKIIEDEISWVKKLDKYGRIRRFKSYM